MKHIEDDAGGKGAGGVALMECDIKDLARLQYVVMPETDGCRL
jgi:hypothetical protein